MRELLESLRFDASERDHDDGRGFRVDHPDRDDGNGRPAEGGSEAEGPDTTEDEEEASSSSSSEDDDEGWKQQMYSIWTGAGGHSENVS